MFGKNKSGTLCGRPQDPQKRQRWPIADRAAPGHTAVAIWEDNNLYVAESTAKGTYWPTNGIQRTPYRQWITQARAAGFSVVHAPLAGKYRKTFDAKGANAFFHSQEGLDYGFFTAAVVQGERGGDTSNHYSKTSKH